MRVLVINAYQCNHEGNKKFNNFLRQIKSSLNEMAPMLGPEGYFLEVKRYDALQSFLFSPDDDMYWNKRVLSSFDSLDCIYIDGDMKLLPWLKRCRQLLYFFEMCYLTNKFVFAAGPGIFFLSYLCSTCCSKLKVINGNGKGGRIHDINKYPKPNVELDEKEVILDQISGDFFQYDIRKECWIPKGNVGLRLFDKSAHIRPVRGGHKQQGPLKNCNPSPKIMEYQVTIQGAHINHPVLKNLNTKDFIANCDNKWTIDNNLNKRCNNRYEVLATYQTRPILSCIVEFRNCFAVQFHPRDDNNFLHSGKILSNFGTFCFDHISNGSRQHRSYEQALTMYRPNFKFSSRTNISPNSITSGLITKNQELRKRLMKKTLSVDELSPATCCKNFHNITPAQENNNNNNNNNNINNNNNNNNNNINNFINDMMTNKMNQKKDFFDSIANNKNHNKNKNSKGTFYQEMIDRKDESDKEEIKKIMAQMNAKERQKEEIKIKRKIICRLIHIAKRCQFDENDFNTLEYLDVALDKDDFRESMEQLEKLNKIKNGEDKETLDERASIMESATESLPSDMKLSQNPANGMLRIVKIKPPSGKSYCNYNHRYKHVDKTLKETHVHPYFSVVSGSPYMSAFDIEMEQHKTGKEKWVSPKQFTTPLLADPPKHVKGFWIRSSGPYMGRPDNIFMRKEIPELNIDKSWRSCGGKVKYVW